VLVWTTWPDEDLTLPSFSELALVWLNGKKSDGVFFNGVGFEIKR